MGEPETKSLPDNAYRPLQAGEVYQPIEASKGELGVYIKSDGGPKPNRVHFRGPSFVNLSALPVMSEGEMVADIVAIIGSLDIVLGEIDR